MNDVQTSKARKARTVLVKDGFPVRIEDESGNAYEITVNAGCGIQVNCIGASSVPFVPHLVERPDLIRAQANGMKRLSKSGRQTW